MAALKLLKTVKNGKLFLHGEGDKAVKVVALENVRFSFPFIGTPSQDKDDNGNVQQKYRSQFLLPKATHVEVKDLLKELLESLVPQGVVVPKANWCLQNGDNPELDPKVREVTAGHWIVSASDGKIRPTARDQRAVVIDDINTIDKTFYGGCWGNALIRPWFFNGKSASNANKTFPKRLVAGLTSVQFVKNDKPFGTGRIDDSDVWKPAGDIDGDGMGAAPAAEDDDDI